MANAGTTTNVKQGTVTQWDRRKGYGFLGDGTERIFLHRRDFLKQHRTPVVGEVIHYVPGRDAAGRRCATKAVQAAGPSGQRTGRWLKFVPLLILLMLIPGTAAWVYGFTSPPWLIVLTVVNIVTWMAYAADKRKAEAEEWRIPESTLHLLELAGGWPAAFLAQRQLRHKCSKQSYQFIFWLIVALYQWVAYDSLHRWKYSLQAWRSFFNT